MESKGNIIQPDDPEFKKILSGAGKAFEEKVKDFDAAEIDFSKAAAAAEVAFRIEGYPKFEVHHAVIEQTDTLSKLVFHCKKMSRNLMAKLSQYLAEEIIRKMKPTAAIQASESPTYRDQWDLILFHVPIFEAKMIHDRILKLIDDFSIKEENGSI